MLEETERFRRSLGAMHVEVRHVGETVKEIPTRQHKVMMVLDVEPDSDVQWRTFNAQLCTQIKGGEEWVSIVEQCALAGLAC